MNWLCWPGYGLICLLYGSQEWEVPALYINNGILPGFLLLHFAPIANPSPSNQTLCSSYVRGWLISDWNTEFLQYLRASLPSRSKPSRINISTHLNKSTPLHYDYCSQKQTRPYFNDKKNRRVNLPIIYMVRRKSASEGRWGKMGTWSDRCKLFAWQEKVIPHFGASDPWNGHALLIWVAARNTSLEVLK